MGLLGNQTQYDYYTGSSFGGYQFVSIDQIISAFLMIYVGEDKIITKVNRTDVQFHAMRAAQELSYDVFRSVKSQEIEVPSSLTMVLPQDYVNYVKLTVIGADGIKNNLYPTGKTSNPFAIVQDDDGVYQYTDVDNDGALDSLDEQSTSNTWSNYQSVNDANQGDTTVIDVVDSDIDYRGRRYGLDPQHAHRHGSFYIDPLKNKIHFSSNVSGKTIILEYVSDGLGTDEEMVVHKFCEEAMYKWIACGILSTRSGMPEYLIARFKKEKFAETRKAKIRLSNIKIEEFTQVLKGMSKIIK